MTIAAFSLATLATRPQMWAGVIAEVPPECAVLLAMAAVMFGIAARKFKWE